MDCSIRISAGLCSLTTRRSFSQLTTSFFGSQCQGIRPALLLALPFVRFEFSLIHCSFFTRLIFLNRVVSLDCISSYFSYSIFKFPERNYCCLTRKMQKSDKQSAKLLTRKMQKDHLKSKKRTP